MRLSPDGSKFATVSADKSVAVFNTADGEMVKHITGCHKMGIYDLVWTGEQEFITCSADNNVKKWSLESDTAVKELTQG